MAFAAGLLAGILSGVFGIGGGIVLVPLLGILLGLGQQDAQGVTLAVMLLPIGLPAVIAYSRRVDIRWRLVGAVILGFVATVAAGAWVANAIDPRPLRGIFAAFVLLVAFRTWRSTSRRPVIHAKGNGASASPWNGVWIGAAGGFFAGLLGVGGGIVMIPLLVRVMKLDQQEAQATSLAVMLPPVGLPGVLAYASARGSLPWGPMALVAAGFALGALLGARIALRVRSVALARAFSIFLVAAALRLAWTTLSG